MSILAKLWETVFCPDSAKVQQMMQQSQPISSNEITGQMLMEPSSTFSAILKRLALINFGHLVGEFDPWISSFLQTPKVYCINIFVEEVVVKKRE